MTQETEDVVAGLREQLWLAAKIGGTLTPKMPQVDAFDAVLAERQSLSDRIDVLARERDHWKAECKALCDVVSEHTKFRAALHQEGIDG